MVSVGVGVSKLGYTNSIFVDPGVKINGAYYRDMLLSQQLLPAIRQVYGVPNLSEFLIVQQDSASAPSAHRARETPAFIHLPKFVVA